MSKLPRLCIDQQYSDRLLSLSSYTTFSPEYSDRETPVSSSSQTHLLDVVGTLCARVTTNIDGRTGNDIEGWDGFHRLANFRWPEHVSLPLAAVSHESG